MKTKKLSFLILAVLMIVMIGLVAVACDKDKTPSFTVTLDARNGEASTTLSAKEGGTVTLPSPEVTGANFLGWFTEPNGAGDQWTNETPVTANVVLYAAWQIAENAKKLAITFDLNGAIDEHGAALNPIVVETVAGLAVYLPAAPTRVGYTFDGWFTKKKNGEKVEDGATFTKATTIYAVWTADANHTHNFNITITVAPTCEKEGYDYDVCACGAKATGTRAHYNVVDATGHDYDFADVKFEGDDDYFAMVVCSHEGCEKAARRESTREFDGAFTYTYSETKQDEINARRDALFDMLDPDHASYIGAYSDEWANEDTYNEGTGEWIHAKQAQYDEERAFEHDVYDVFYDDLKYLTEQYQVCYVFYCVNDKNAEWQDNYDAIQKARTDMISDYYALFRKIYNTKYREYFFCEEDGWSPEDIEKALVLSDTYGGGEYAQIKKRIDEIENEFRDLERDQQEKGDTVPNLYAEYVSLNNQLARMVKDDQGQQKYQNYVEYAYENVYDREYSPEDTAHLRAYAKQYMKTVYSTIYKGYRETKDNIYSDTSPLKPYKTALLDESIFDSKLTTDLVSGYLKLLNIKDDQGNIIQNYYGNANELFRVGNYYPGKYGGAFNYWISAQDKSVLYFGPGSYSGAFTFIHEFGHYNNSYYNKGIGMSYDLDETHSQGNEMMFLAWLSSALPAGYDKVYKQVKYDNLFNMVAIVMLAMAVDEFEQAVYTNTYPGYEEGISASQYDDLFKTIMASYGIAQSLNSVYWRYVVIESACYYISYSISAMSSLQLYALAMAEIKETGDFAETREKYYKLITFTDDDQNAHTDFVGDRVVDIGYADTLKYAGLLSPFDEDFYQFLANSEYLK